MALYRKYRPGSFAELVGQEQVTKPLSTALDSGRINHAYLFSGPRGCGKTSSARILARSLNCVNGPTSTPCGVCPSCVALAPNGPGSLDVTELDAASHNGVDDMRELRDRAAFAPAESRYRIFIIDEAHMITSSGANALLKVVEEPPAHLIFIFATTEPEKVIPTIRSRVHHYPFRLLTPGAMRQVIDNAIRGEGIPVEEAAYPLVIRAGNGSPRDTLSVLDQLLAGAGPGGLTYDLARLLLGITDDSYLDAAVAALSSNDAATLFQVVDDLIENGVEALRFANDLLDRLRDLLVLQTVPQALDMGLVDVPSDRGGVLMEQAATFAPGALAHIATTLSDGRRDLKGATSPRLLLEILCTKLLLSTSQPAPAQPGSFVPTTPGQGIGAATASQTQPGAQAAQAPAKYERKSVRLAREKAERERAAQLAAQQQAAAQQPAAQQTTEQATPPATPQQETLKQQDVAPTGQQTPAEAPHAARPAPQAQPEQQAQATPVTQSAQSAQPDQPQPTAQPDQPRRANSQVEHPVEPQHQPDTEAQPAAPQSVPSPTTEVVFGEAPAEPTPGEPESSYSAPEKPGAESNSSPTPSEDPFEAIRSAWPRLRAAVQRADLAAGILLAEARPLGMRDGTLILGHNTGALAASLNTPEHNKTVTETLNAETGRRFGVQCVIGTDPVAAGFSVPAQPTVWNPSHVPTAARESSGESPQEPERPADTMPRNLQPAAPEHASAPVTQAAGVPASAMPSSVPLSHDPYVSAPARRSAVEQAAEQAVNARPIEPAQPPVQAQPEEYHPRTYVEDGWGEPAPIGQALPKPKPQRVDPPKPQNSDAIWGEPAPIGQQLLNKDAEHQPAQQEQVVPPQADHSATQMPPAQAHQVQDYAPEPGPAQAEESAQYAPTEPEPADTWPSRMPEPAAQAVEPTAASPEESSPQPAAQQQAAPAPKRRWQEAAERGAASLAKKATEPTFADGAPLPPEPDWDEPPAPDPYGYPPDEGIPEPVPTTMREPDVEPVPPADAVPSQPVGGAEVPAAPTTPVVPQRQAPRPAPTHPSDAPAVEAERAPQAQASGQQAAENQPVSRMERFRQIQAEAAEAAKHAPAQSMEPSGDVDRQSEEEEMMAAAAAEPGSHDHRDAMSVAIDLLTQELGARRL